MELERGAAQSNCAGDRDGYLVAMGFEGGLGHEKRVGRLDLAQLERLVWGAEYGICRLRIWRACSGGRSLRLDGQPGARGEKGLVHQQDAAAHLQRGIWLVQQLNDFRGQLEQAEMLLLVCYGEGHTAFVLLRGHVLVDRTTPKSNC